MLRKMVGLDAALARAVDCCMTLSSDGLAGNDESLHPSPATLPSGRARQRQLFELTLCRIKRPFSRSQSFFFSVLRLSCSALPLASAISTFTRPPL